MILNRNYAPYFMKISEITTNDLLLRSIWMVR